tara:strand:- start:631 stop:1503 length:873 start_codon:yes stop_codon:yes gene_type:complete
MENLDLDIENYDLDELLNLFNLSYNFGEEELKKTRRTVQMTHPDKSGLDKKYFLFFNRAYKMVSQIYYFRGKKSKKMYDVDYVAEDGEHLELIKSLDGKSVKEFNAWFNKMFDSVRLKDEEVDNGYGDWMKNSEIKDTKNVKLRDFGTEFEKRKNECKALVVHQDIMENTMSMGTNLSREKPELYTSDIFSKLNYEDLKRAHTETVVPVTMEDYNNVPKFNSVDDYNKHRQQSMEKPLSLEQSKDYLRTRENKKTEVSMRRAYNLIKREEEMEKAQESWWKNFKRLKSGK